MIKFINTDMKYLNALQEQVGNRFELLRIRSRSLKQDGSIRHDVVESYDRVAKKLFFLYINDQSIVFKKEEM